MATKSHINLIFFITKPPFGWVRNRSSVTTLLKVFFSHLIYYLDGKIEKMSSYAPPKSLAKIFDSHFKIFGIFGQNQAKSAWIKSDSSAILLWEMVATLYLQWNWYHQ